MMARSIAILSIVLFLSCSVMHDNLFEYISSKYVYVSIANGDNSNTGDMLNPVKTIGMGIQRALQLGITKIKITSDTYKKSCGLDDSTSDGLSIIWNNIELYGGWNESFMAQDGYTILDGEFSVYHVIKLNDVSNVKLDRLEIMRGRANGSNVTARYGGGILLNSTEKSVLTNLIVHDNNTNSLGGGIGVYYSSNNSIGGCVIHDNSSDYGGGGIALSYSDYNIINSTVYSNLVAQSSTFYGGGGILFYYSDYNMAYGNINSNSANTGGGICFTESDYNKISVELYDCSATVASDSQGGGGGIRFYRSTNCEVLNSSIYSNNSAYRGGGVYLYNSSSNLFENSRIDENIASSRGGGIELFSDTVIVTDNSIINCSIQNNNSSSNGGGIGLHAYGIGMAVNNTLIYKCNISGNYANSICGGVDINLLNNATADSNKIIECTLFKNTGNSSTPSAIRSNLDSSNTEIRGCIIKENINSLGVIYINGSGSSGAHKIHDCIITDNNASRIIDARLLSFGASIEIEGNTFGGSGSGCYAIYESGTVAYHTICNNIFYYPSTMDHLYKDSANGDLDTILLLESSDTGASVYSSNITQ